jgi:thiamine monophosphate kinase
MDTSDGFVATIDQLARINEVGFRITAPTAELLHPLAAELGAAVDLPAIPFLSGGDVRQYVDTLLRVSVP